ncbi:MAG TPA: type II toxin-antitoxin system VapC family toxin [Galbitalea sp.]
MIVFVDAHALLWWLDDAATLSPPARRTIADPANDILVSAASVWEIAAKQAAGRLTGSSDLLTEIEAAQFATVPFTATDAVIAANLPRHHGDPFDRMLIAQAQRLDALIISRDRAFAAYDVHVLAA